MLEKKTLHMHSSKKLKKNTPSISISHRRTYTTNLFDELIKLGILIIQTTSQTIKNFTNILKRTNNITTFHIGIYAIPCNDCDKYYIHKHNSDKKMNKICGQYALPSLCSFNTQIFISIFLFLFLFLFFLFLFLSGPPSISSYAYHYEITNILMKSLDK